MFLCYPSAKTIYFAVQDRKASTKYMGLRADFSDYAIGDACEESHDDAGNPLGGVRAHKIALGRTTQEICRSITNALAAIQEEMGDEWIDALLLVESDMASPLEGTDQIVLHDATVCAMWDGKIVSCETLLEGSPLRWEKVIDVWENGSVGDASICETFARICNTWGIQCAFDESFPTGCPFGDVCCRSISAEMWDIFLQGYKEGMNRG